MCRLLPLLLVASGIASAQLVETRIEFRDNGCVPCTESLQRRLERVRGVDSVALDIDQGVIEMRFAPENRVRLLPLRARITQDGTEILEMRIRARGAASRAGFTLGGAEEILTIFGDNEPESGSFLVEGRVTPHPNKTPSLQIQIDSAKPLD